MFPTQHSLLPSPGLDLQASGFAAAPTFSFIRPPNPAVALDLVHKTGLHERICSADDPEKQTASTEPWLASFPPRHSKTHFVGGILNTKAKH